jgi:hypothetical protein
MSTQNIRRPGQYPAPASTADDLARAALEEKEPDPESEEKSSSSNDSPAKKSPMERWRDAIEAADLTEEDADKILDAVLATGHYDKSHKLFRGRMTVVLRSRDSASLQRVSDALDSIRTNDVRVHTQMMNRYNLAASLVRYQDKSFKHPPANGDINEREKSFAERLSFIDTVPAPVLVQLYTLLSKFDNAVFAAMSEGAELGF